MVGGLGVLVTSALFADSAANFLYEIAEDSEEEYAPRRSPSELNDYLVSLIIRDATRRGLSKANANR